jgi:hypothetical protein
LLLHCYLSFCIFPSKLFLFICLFEYKGEVIFVYLVSDILLHGFYQSPTVSDSLPQCPTLYSTLAFSGFLYSIRTVSVSLWQSLSLSTSLYCLSLAFIHMFGGAIRVRRCCSVMQVSVGSRSVVGGRAQLLRAGRGWKATLLYHWMLWDLT